MPHINENTTSVIISMLARIAAPKKDISKASKIH
jgi:hypothetical protein